MAPLRSALGALLAWVATAAADPASPPRRPPLPPVRPLLLEAEPEPAPPAPARTPGPSSGAGSACLANLKAQGVAAEAVAAPLALLPDCGVADPVRVASIRLADGSTLDLPGRPVLDCPFAADFAGFARDLVAPLAAVMLGAPVVALETGPGYECRGRNQVPGAKTSAHGQGIAIDVSAVVLADRRWVAVARQADAREETYVRTVRRAACGWFATVLGPGSDAAHADHLHLDTQRHGASDGYRICE